MEAAVSNYTSEKSQATIVMSRAESNLGLNGRSDGHHRQ